ncbi:MAG TPA: hypothetical protein VIA61_00070 [Methylomirabilota bacterium]|jgi:hypothetical protein
MNKGLWLSLLIAVSIVATACATTTGRVENGVYHSAKGYQVTLPTGGWTVDPAPRADLALEGAAGAGGMLVDATCGGPETARSLDVLARHLTFGLTKRDVIERGMTTVGGREAAHSVVRGMADGRDVTVEAMVMRADPCVHDFLYVAPTGAFAAGRPAFRALVESFALEPGR